MLNWLIKSLRKFLSTLLHNILVTILVVTIGVPTLLSWATGTLNILIQTIKLPVPVWATISLVFLCCLYIYLKVTQHYQKTRPSYPPQQYFCLPEFFDYNGASWKIISLPDQKIKVDFPSYCIQHHLQHIQEVHNYICPECRSDHIPVSPYFLKNIQEIHKIVNTICQQFTPRDRQQTGDQ